MHRNGLSNKLKFVMKKFVKYISLIDLSNVPINKSIIKRPPIKNRPNINANKKRKMSYIFC
jgi:hypothetical protein